jgi:ABC-2 type transport system permease protein
MKGVLIVGRKEMREMLKNKSTLILALFLALFFSIFPAMGISKADDPAVSLNNSVFYLSLTLGVFICYMFTGQVFFREKQEKIIETLLCAPVSLRTLWFGKVLGVAMPSYSFSILSAISIILISNIFSRTFLFPSVAVILHLLIIVPLFIASVVGLMGFVQFLLGMRENRIIGLLIFVVIFGALYGMGGIMRSDFVGSWLHVIALLIASVLLVALTAYLARYLSKEKIVTTIS